MTRYEGEQKLRGIERNIRHYKRRALTQEAAGVDSTKARVKIGEWQAAARDFTKQTGIQRDNAREFIGTIDGNQPRGINTAIQKTITKNVAETIFPLETWTEISENLFLAEGRTPANPTERKKQKKEILQAKILTAHSHTVYLSPEKSAGKNFDSITDGVKTELKHITGNIKTLGTQYKYALKQGDNIFIRTQDKTQQEIYSKLIGETKTLIENDVKLSESSIIYVWIDGENILHQWKLKNIIDIAKSLIK